MVVEPMTEGLNVLEVSCTEYRASPHIKGGQMADGLKDDTMTRPISEARISVVSHRPGQTREPEIYLPAGRQV